MRRKSILTGGVILSIIYALSLVASIGLVFSGALYFFAGETFQLISDLCLPLLSPFMLWGDTIMLVLVALVLVAVIMLLIASTRFIKYSGATKEQFLKKKSLLSFNVVLVIIVLGFIAYLLTDHILNVGFNGGLLYPIVLIALALFHILSIIFIIVGLSKERPEVTASQKIEEHQTSSSQPAIYTADLDDEPEQKKEEIEEVKKAPAPLKPSESSAKLVDAIGKLDQMRKEGAITQQEYIRLRQEMIKKFIK